MAVRVRATVKIDAGLMKKASTTAPRVMRFALKRGGKHALKRIKGAGPKPAPKRTGNLRDSYGMKVSHRGLRVLIRSDPTIAHYAGFVEFGTSRMRAQPHFRPAVKAARQIVRTVANTVLAREFKGL